MSSIKMVAVDMDGTFVRSDQTFDEERFKRILARMKDVDCRFVVASGNQYWQLRDFFPGYDEELAFVAENGAYVKDGPEVVFVGEMDPTASRTVIEWCQARPDVQPILCCESCAYAERGLVSEAMFELSQTWYHRLTWIDDMRDVSEPALKFALNVPDAETMAYFDSLCAELPEGMTPTTSGHGAIDIIATGVHKASGLARLCARWNVDAHDCAAFGDGGNDLEMLRWVGHPYAMANASEDVKAVGTVCASNDEDGVLEVLEELVC